MLPVLCLLCCSAALAAAAGPPDAGTALVSVSVSDGGQLVDALMDPLVGRISLAKNIALEDAHWPPKPYKLGRNVTVDSDPAGPHKVIDFDARAAQSKLSLSPGTNLSFIHLTLRNTRYGAGADIDLLAPSPDGIIYLHDVAKVQSSCPPLVQKQILAYQRDPSVPGVNLITFPKEVVWDGKTYRDAISYDDFSTRMMVGENVAEGGYVVHKRGSLKLCERVVDPACAAEFDAQVCTRRQMDEEFYALHPQPPARELPAAAKAGVAVAAVAVAALAAAALAVALARRRWRRQQHPLLPQHAAPGSCSDGSSPGSGSPTHGAGKAAVKAPAPGAAKLFGGGPAGTRGHSSHDSNGSSASSYRIAVGRHGMPGSLASPRSSSDSRGITVSTGTPEWSYLGGGSGSASASRQASLALPDVLGGTLSKEEAAGISLGSMIGAGSYGRVFAGEFRGKEVAIKVIHHNHSATAQVSGEVKLMMTFHHPNLVRAYEYVTWGASGVSQQRTTRPDLDLRRGEPITVVPVAGGGAGFAAGSDPSGSSGGAAATTATAKGSSMVETWIISQMARGGTLQDAVMAHKEGPFFEGDVPRVGFMLQMLLGVARGMAWLHASNVLHGDLKAANVLLFLEAADGDSSSSGADDGSGAAAEVAVSAKVADFGLSRTMFEGATHLSTHTMGTITHQPPELMRNGRLSKPADVWAFGVVMWELAMAPRAPFSGRMMGEIMLAVVVENARLQFAPFVPEEYVALARECWHDDPAQRPTFEEICARIEELLLRQDALQREAPAAEQGGPGCAGVAAAAAADT